MDMGLSDKVILITGAASGIGAAIAHAAKAEGAQHLFLTDRTPGPNIFQADLTDPDAPRTIADQVLKTHGRIDILVNAAGLTTRASTTTATPETWDSLFTVNARAAFFLMQEAIRDMTARKTPGTILNILSMNAHCGIPELAVYSATKAALSTLTKNAARSHMSQNIRVNGINLGWIATPSEDHMQSVTLGHGPNWQADAAATLPLGRLITAEETARLAIFLMGTASAPLSGSVIDFEQKIAGAL
jgi:NAD(P)-dependent dehydrogenase (short-subunit alcohol dehydrogenase family)